VWWEWDGLPGEVVGAVTEVPPLALLHIGVAAGRLAEPDHPCAEDCFFWPSGAGTKTYPARDAGPRGAPDRFVTEATYLGHLGRRDVGQGGNGDLFEV
jgi:hypothetical protein